MLRPLSLVTASIALGGCFDWQVGATRTDAGREAGAPLDGESRKPDVGAPANEAGQSADASHGVDAGHDARGDTASCPTLLANVQAARATAVRCTETTAPPMCTTSVTDPCGCELFVGEATSTATASNVSAVDAFKAGGCTPTCTSCTAEGTEWLCLEGESDGGTFVFSCTP